MTELIKLPIDEVLPEVIRAAAPRQSGPRSIVLEAPTGAGKTTRVPPALLPLLAGRILMTEPRRVAARAAARRIADELGVRVGDEVGYHVRFDRRASDRSRIVVATEGILVRMLQRDPFAEGIDALVFDEFHERSVDTDLALALAREIQRDARPDLLIVVMSATLDPEPIAEWLGGAAIVRSEGRAHPVELVYPTRPDDRPLEVRVAAKIRETMAAPAGHTLVFLPGYREIRKVGDLLEGATFAVDVLHGSMDAKDQDRVIRPLSEPRVILSTNVAESSLTIPGVRTVIDSGWARVMRYDASSGLDRLGLERISSASAQQRAGRAGREAPGTCHRLWGTEVTHRMPEQLEAEIHRVDLAPIALQLLAWGVANPIEFEWFEPPDPTRWNGALDLLEQLGLVREGRITPLGSELSRMPLHPRLARCVHEGASRGVLPETALAAAILSDRDVLRPARHHEERSHASCSDLFDRVLLIESKGRTPRALVSRFRPASIDPIRRAARQLSSGLKERGSDESREDAFCRAILAGFPDRVAQRRSAGGASAHLADGKGAQLHPASALSPDDSLFVAVSAAPNPRGDALVTIASRVDEAWLDPALIERTVSLRFDSAIGRVTSVTARRYLALTLDERPGKLEHSPAVEACLLDAATASPETALNVRDPDFARLRDRVEWLRRECPELELPALDTVGLAALLPLLCHGRSSFRELRGVDLTKHLRSVLPFGIWRTLDSLAPESVAIPSGRTSKLTYPESGAPILAARIQELFGLHDTPRIAGGKVPLVVHLLAPNMRPQQITSDLRSFWTSGYPEVRKELRARYPKHSWPEDPWTAKAQRRPPRRR